MTPVTEGFFAGVIYSLRYCRPCMPSIFKTIMALENSALRLVNEQPSPLLSWQSETCCLPSPEQISVFSDHSYNATYFWSHTTQTAKHSSHALDKSLITAHSSILKACSETNALSLALGAIVTDPNPPGPAWTHGISADRPMSFQNAPSCDWTVVSAIVHFSLGIV